MNNFKTGLLLTSLTVLLVFAGQALGGPQGAMFAFLFALAMNAYAYWFSDKMVLRMYRAEQIDAENDPELHGLVTQLAQRGQIPVPRIYRIPSNSLNAFATGRNPAHAAVAVTDGLRQALGREELAGVLAHELSHVRHRDILIGTIAATVAGAISMLASWAQWGAMFGGFGRSDDRGGGNLIVVLLVSILAALGASLVQMAISRSREFEADRGAAELTGDPNGLISALRKLTLAAERLPTGGSPATAHLFIVNPLRGGGINKLFSTHPPMEQRIERLQGLIGLNYSS